MKDFLLIANTNAITYKEMFPLLKGNKMRIGYRTIGSDMFFQMTDKHKKQIVKEKKKGSGWGVVDGEVMGRVANACWFTTLHTPDKKKLVLTKKYHHELYPHYDNYNAIEVSRIKNIPYDYEGVMGVPITIFDYDLDNVEVVSNSDFAQEDIPGWSGVSQEFYDMYYEQGNTGQIEVGWPLPHYTKDGKAIIPYKRVLIKMKQL